jgi:hypothetical protein
VSSIHHACDLPAQSLAGIDVVRWVHSSEAKGEHKYVTGVKGKDLINLGHAPTTFGVLTNMFLKDVCFSLKAYCFCPFKWVAHLEVLAVSKSTE